MTMTQKTELGKMGELIKILKKHKNMWRRRNLLIGHVNNKNTFHARLWLYLLNPYIVFNIAEIPKTVTTHFNTFEHYSPLTNPQSLLTFFNDVATAQISHDKAQTAVAHIYRILNEHEKLAFEAIITKNSKCRVTIAEMNNAIPGLIPEINVQKPTKYNKIKTETIVNTTAIVEPFLVGERAIFIHSILNQPNIFLTADGKNITNFPHITNYLKNNTKPGTVLDGVLVYNNGLFNTKHELNKYLATKTINTPDCGVKYIVFDQLTITEWFQQQTNTFQLDRTKSIAGIGNSDSPVKPIYSTTVNNIDQVNTLFNDFVDMGYLGIVIKNAFGKYIFNKLDTSQNWIKLLKPITEYGTVLDILPYSQTYYQKVTQGCSAGVLKIKRDDGKIILIRITSALSNKQRINIWANKESYIGAIAEISTEGRDEENNFIRPVFKKFITPAHKEHN